MNTKEFIRFIKFGLFSTSAGLVEMGAFAILNEFTGWRYWPCYIIALTMSVVWNFFFNRKFTFKSNANITRAMLQVFAYYAVFTPLSSWAGDYLAEDLHWNEYLVTALNMALNFITEFLFQRYVVYRGKVDNAGSPAENAEAAESHIAKTAANELTENAEAAESHIAKTAANELTENAEATATPKNL